MSRLYYYAGTPLIKRTVGSMGCAFRVIGGANAGVYYRHGDHLGSTSLISNASGNKVAGSEVVYAPFGEVRTGDLNSLAAWTDFGFTSQKHDLSTGGLMYYNARYYLPNLRRFISADTVVPDPKIPQNFNRYSYALNNPIRYTDPSGHCGADTGGNSIGGAVGGTIRTGACLVLQTHLEETYGIDIAGQWTLEQMVWLGDMLQASADAIGLERFKELLREGASSKDPNIDHLTIALIEADETYPDGSRHPPALWDPDTGTIYLTDELWDDVFMHDYYYYSDDPDVRRDYAITHEIGHVVLDALRKEVGGGDNTYYEDLYDQLTPDSSEFFTYYQGRDLRDNEDLAAEYANAILGIYPTAPGIDDFWNNTMWPAIRGENTNPKRSTPTMDCRPYEPC